MYTITTSANTHEFTLQCTLRRIPGCGCGCGTYTSKVSLSGCGENIAFGQRAAMRMKKKLRLDASTVVNFQNYNVGRNKGKFHALKNYFKTS